MASYVVEAGQIWQDDDMTLAAFLATKYPDGMPHERLKEAATEITAGVAYLRKTFEGKPIIDSAHIVVRSTKYDMGRCCVLYTEAKLLPLNDVDEPKGQSSSVGIVLAEMSFAQFLPDGFDRPRFIANVMQLFVSRIQEYNNEPVHKLTTKLEYFADTELFEVETNPVLEDRPRLRREFYERVENTADPDLKNLHRSAMILIVDHLRLKEED